MPIEVETPDGGIAEFPDGTPTDVIRQALAKRFPRQSTTAETVADVGEQAIRGLSRGIVGTVTLPYRAIDWVGEKITGGDFLPNVEDMPLYKPFLQQPEAATTAGRYAQSVGEAVGASAIPGAGLMSQAQRLAAMTPTTTGRAIAQAIAEPIARSPGRAVAADIAAAAGSGIGQQAAAEGGFGPVGQTIAGIAGAAAPLATAAGVSRLTQAGREAIAGRSPYAQMAQRLAEEPGTGSGPTLDELAESIATGAQRQALDILGEEMVRARGNTQAAVNATIDRLMREQNIARSTATQRVRELLRSQQANELLLAEQPAIARSILDTRRARPSQRGREGIQELEREAGRVEEVASQRELERIANAFTGESASIVRNAIANRMESLRDQLRQRLAQQPFAPGTLDDADFLIQSMTRKAQEEYAKVYSGPGGAANVNYRLLHGLLQRAVDRHLARMAGRSGEQAEALRRAIDELFVELPDGRRLIMPSLQQLQDMRGAIRGMITAADRAGRSHIVATLQPLYDDITRIMKRASPAWARANDRWADMKIAERARELGEAFAERMGPKYRQHLNEFLKLAPEVQDLVRIEFAQRLIDKIDNAGGIQAIVSQFDKPAMRTVIRDIFGNEASVEFSRLLRDAKVAARSTRMMGGSPTQPRQQLEAIATGDIDLIASLDQASISSFRNAAVKWVANKLKERRNREIAKIATTPMRDVPRVAEHLERMRRARARMLAGRERPQPQLAPAGVLAPALEGGLE